MTSRQEIEAAITQFFHAMDTQNLELVQELIAHDAGIINIGTDRDEIWKGWDDLYEATVQQFENLEYYKADVHDLAITVADSETVAWYSHLLDAEIKSGDGKQIWRNARFTGVFEKRNDRWKMVQTHVSLPESVLH